MKTIKTFLKLFCLETTTFSIDWYYYLQKNLEMKE